MKKFLGIFVVCLPVLGFGKQNFVPTDEQLKEVKAQFERAHKICKANHCPNLILNLEPDQYIHNLLRDDTAKQIAIEIKDSILNSEINLSAPMLPEFIATSGENGGNRVFPTFEESREHKIREIADKHPRMNEIRSLIQSADPEIQKRGAELFWHFSVFFDLLREQEGF